MKRVLTKEETAIVDRIAKKLEANLENSLSKDYGDMLVRVGTWEAIHEILSLDVKKYAIGEILKELLGNKMGDITSTYFSEEAIKDALEDYHRNNITDPVRFQAFLDTIGFTAEGKVAESKKEFSKPEIKEQFIKGKSLVESSSKLPRLEVRMHEEKVDLNALRAADVLNKYVEYVLGNNKLDPNSEIHKGIKKITSSKLSAYEKLQELEKFLGKSDVKKESSGAQVVYSKFMETISAYMKAHPPAPTTFRVYSPSFQKPIVTNVQKDAGVSPPSFGSKK